MSGYHHGNLRQTLVDGAKELIAERGPDGFTLRELARRVGVSHTAAYRHFADKDQLLAAVAGEGFRGLQAAFEAAVSAADGPVQAFAGTGLAYVRFALENPANFQVMFRMMDCDDAELDQAGASAYGVLVEQVRAAQEAGFIREGPVEILALTAWSMVHGLARLLVDGAVDRETLGDPEQVAAEVTALLMSGLAR